MHPFLEKLKKNLKDMESLARQRKAPIFYAKKGFESSPFWLLIFVVLSSRTKDETTGKAVRNLINRFKTPEALANASPKEVEKLIYGVGFYKTKAPRLIKIAKHVVEKGLPKTFEELVKLPGVGRKTANVVLGEAFKKPVIGVDTHVHRISNRLGLVSTKTPEKTEEELKKIVPRSLRRKINKVFVAYGQTICKPKKPLCGECVVRDYCDFYKNKLKD